MKQHIRKLSKYFCAIIILIFSSYSARSDPITLMLLNTQIISNALKLELLNTKTKIEDIDIDSAIKARPDIDIEEITSLREKLKAAKDFIRDAEKQQQLIANQLSKIQILAGDLEAKNVNLSLERDKILDEKLDIQRREKLFSIGFYASMSAAFLAVLGLLMKFPTMLLDRKLKLLEIREKEIALESATLTSTTSGTSSTSEKGKDPK